MEKKFLTATADIQVEFFDLDPMNVVWHGNYVKYMEAARCVLLSKLNYDYKAMEKDGYVWPVVQLSIKYIRPLRFMQKVRVEVSLVEYEICLKLQYRFIDAETGKVITKAESTQMAVQIKTGESCLGSPKELVEKVRKYLAEEHHA